jgi:tetratricopeptide (TPR) repeat protein
MRAEERGVVARGALNLGLLHRDRGDHQASLDAFARAAQAGNWKGAFQIGKTQFERGEYRPAEQSLKRALELGGPPDGILQRLGVCRQAIGDRLGAERYYQQAADAGIAIGAAWLGLLLEARGDVKAAEQAYVRADNLGDAWGATNLGARRADLGDLDGAEEAWQRGSERGDPVATANLTALQTRIAGGDNQSARSDPVDAASSAGTAANADDAPLHSVAQSSGSWTYARWAVRPEPPDWRHLWGSEALIPADAIE